MTYRLKLARVNALKFRVSPRIPAQMDEGPGISIVRSNGVYTFGLDYTRFSRIEAFDATQKLVAVYDPSTEQWNTVAISTIVSADTVERTVIDAGDVYATVSDAYIRLNKTIPEATNVILPAAALRSGLEITIKDVAGNASSYNFTITPDGSEEIDGLSSLVATMDYQLIRLKPRSGGWDILNNG